MLAFVAAYREAFEIVLFYQALVLDTSAHVRQIWIGTAIGLSVLLVIAVSLLRVGQKLRPAPFLLASSVFLALLSFMLVGKGVRALQEQGTLLLLLIASAIWPWWSARRSSGAPAPAE